MNEFEPDGSKMAEEPVANRVLPIEARVAGRLGSIPVGLAVGHLFRNGLGYEENGQVMAFALLAIVPFVFALLRADANGVFNTLVVAGPLCSVSGAISVVPIGPLFLLGLVVSPFIIGLALIFGLTALGTSRYRVKDASLALAILGLSPALSGLFVFLADSAVASLVGLPWGRTGAPPRPMYVFAAAVAITVLASVAFALWMRFRQRAVPSKLKTQTEWSEFDRD